MIKIIRQILRTGIVSEPLEAVDPGADPAAAKIRDAVDRLEYVMSRRFRRSLTIRAVDAGSCNGCELEIHALNNPLYNCERLGLHFTASPRFADILLVTGPVTRNMEIALRRTYDATPEPKLVIAVGDCGRDGGLFGKSYASLGGIDQVIPVDAVIPGCPPTPKDLIQGIAETLVRRIR